MDRVGFDNHSPYSKKLQSKSRIDFYLKAAKHAMGHLLIVFRLGYAIEKKKFKIRSNHCCTDHAYIHFYLNCISFATN